MDNAPNLIFIWPKAGRTPDTAEKEEKKKNKKKSAGVPLYKHN